MIDWGRVKELQDDLGAEDFNEITALFMEEVETCLGGLLSGGTQNFRDDLHFLKGSAANLGFATLRDTCEALEQSLDTDEIANLKEIYAASKAGFLSGLDQTMAS